MPAPRMRFHNTVHIGMVRSIARLFSRTDPSNQAYVVAEKTGVYQAMETCSPVRHSESMRRYLAESARPLSSMVFVAPLLIIYEFGGALLGSSALRNGADTWLRGSLQSLGFNQHFLLPLLACAILLSWHHIRHDRWSLHPSVLPVMLTESIVFAFLLFSVAHIQHLLFAPQLSLNVGETDSAGAGTLGRLIGYCGAGIYEELLFRLVLLRAVAGALHGLGVPSRAGLGWAVVSTSLLFSAAHYQFISGSGYPFDWYSFSFRLIAGLFFGVLFVWRGFGIAAGTHAFYDMLVELL